jgi:hypothetical protein
MSQPQQRWSHVCSLWPRRFRVPFISLSSSARNYGGLIHTESGGSVVLLSSSMTSSSARNGGCVSVFSGSVFIVNTTLSTCSALRGGGAVSLMPAITAHPLFRDTKGQLLDGQVHGARLQTSVGLHSSFIAYGSAISNHVVLGITSEPGDGAVMLMKGGAGRCSRGATSGSRRCRRITGASGFFWPCGGKRLHCNAHHTAI